MTYHRTRGYATRPAAALGGRRITIGDAVVTITSSNRSPFRPVSSFAVHPDSTPLLTFANLPLPHLRPHNQTRRVRPDEGNHSDSCGVAAARLRLRTRPAQAHRGRGRTPASPERNESPSQGRAEAPRTVETRRGQTGTRQTTSSRARLRRSQANSGGYRVRRNAPPLRPAHDGDQ